MSDLSIFFVFNSFRNGFNIRDLSDIEYLGTIFFVFNIREISSVERSFNIVFKKLVTI